MRALLENSLSVSAIGILIIKKLPKTLVAAPQYEIVLRTYYSVQQTQPGRNFNCFILQRRVLEPNQHFKLLQQ